MYCGSLAILSPNGFLHAQKESPYVILEFLQPSKNSKFLLIFQHVMNGINNVLLDELSEAS